MTTMIGIDPHKATHTAVAIDRDEQVLDELRVRAASSQMERLRAWAAQFDEPAWAVESARGLGYLLAQQLVGAGETVFDVPPARFAGACIGLGTLPEERPNDARSVAIAALRSNRLTRVTTDDHAQVLRLFVKRHRDTAQLRAKQIVRLSALMCELRPGGIATKTTPRRAIELLESLPVTDEVTRTKVLIAGELLDDIERFPTKAHFATCNATAPLEASSGGRTRHRLNPRGNRTLNFAIHIAAVVQIRTGGEGRDYYDRKIAEGKTNKEAIRALKRRISDRVYTHLVADARRAATS